MAQGQKRSSNTLVVPQAPGWVNLGLFEFFQIPFHKNLLSDELAG